MTIDEAFSGNLLAIDVTTKPEYVVNSQIIGYLYQIYEAVSKGYAIKSGKDLIRLELPETEKLVFIPTNYLSDNYTLKIDYTTVGITAVVDGENTAAIPEIILDLPPIIAGIQGDILGLNIDVQGLQQSVADISLDWDSITGKPETFAPSTHTHAIGDVTGLETSLTSLSNNLATIDADIANLSSRVDDLENAPASSESFIFLVADTTLESNKKYLITSPDLTLVLPSTPSIGDVITVANGNFSTKVWHGNSSHQVLNQNTLTTSGLSSGLILKNNADVVVIYLGSNLWKTAVKNRIVNNWQAPIEDDSSPVLQSYTAAPFGDGTPVSGFGFDKLYDGNLNRGFDAAGNSISCIVNFGSPKRLVKFDYWNGFDGAFLCANLKIYQGSTKSGALLKNLNFAGLPISGNNIFLDTVVSSQFYVFEFTKGSGLSFAELKLYAPELIGGEVVVT